MTENEIIAEFMGLKKSVVFGKVIYGEYQVLDYDKDWSDLMPVVEKIYKLEYDGVTNGVKFTLKNSRAVIKDGKKTFSCHTISPLNSTYRVVVEFIKWYITPNQNDN